MRNNKLVLFAAMGFAGGAIGSLLAEVVDNLSFLHVIINTTLWAAVFSSVMTLGLFWAVEIYNRKPRLSTEVIKTAVFSGLVAGALGGGIAELVYRANPHSKILQASCWGIAGLLIGWRLSSAVPNLGTKRGILAGGLGGVVGGVAFITVSSLFVEIIGRLVGIGILGAALGLAIVVVEMMFREAFLEVIWAPKEKTTVTLGSRPVSIGGGDDHVHVRGLPSKAVQIAFDGGKIKYTDHTGKKAEFKDGSKIQIGKLEIVVHAQQ